MSSAVGAFPPQPVNGSPRASLPRPGGFQGTGRPLSAGRACGPGGEKYVFSLLAVPIDNSPPFCCIICILSLNFYCLPLSSAALPGHRSCPGISPRRRRARPGPGVLAQSYHVRTVINFRAISSHIPIAEFFGENEKKTWDVHKKFKNRREVAPCGAPPLGDIYRGQVYRTSASR